MLRGLTLVLIATGCGRLGFDSAVGDGDGDGPIASGHDEDGDGVPDALDVCPHLPGTQLDVDADGVGDDCDPQPMVGRQRLALFATMRAGDQPFVSDGTGAWTQRDDAFHFDGDRDGRLTLAMPVVDVRLAAGIDVTASLNPTSQHQLALALLNGPASPYYFIELNQGTGYNNASVTFFNGSSYTSLDSQTLTTAGIHTGEVFLQSTVFGPPGATQALEGGWAGEVYNFMVATPSYTGATTVQFNLNNLEIDVRYLWIVVGS